MGELMATPADANPLQSGEAGGAGKVAGMTTPRECNCSLCFNHRALKRIAAALDDLNAAAEADMEYGSEMEGCLYHLRDEIDAVAGSWRGVLVRRRLRAALRCTDPPRMPTFQSAAPGEGDTRRGAGRSDQ